MITAINNPYRNRLLLLEVKEEAKSKKEILLFCKYLANINLSDYFFKQAFFKREIKILLSRQALPYALFRKYLSQIAEIIKPEDSMNIILEAFRQFSAQPGREICGRYYWQYHEELMPEHRGKKVYVEDTICLITHEALLTSIFGIGKKRLVESLRISKIENDHLPKMVSLIENNCKELKNLSRMSFVFYSFLIPSEHQYSCFRGHAFVVLQFINKEKNVAYRLFQSFVCKYRLKDYLEKQMNSFNHEEFKAFLAGLQELLSSDTWTEALEKFYTTYFNLKEGFPIDLDNPCKVNFTLQWRFGTIQDLLLQNSRYRVFSEVADFPTFNFRRPI